MSDASGSLVDDDVLRMPMSPWTVVVLWMRPTPDGSHVEPVFFCMTVTAGDADEASRVAFEVAAQKDEVRPEDVCIGPVFKGDLDPEDEDQVAPEWTSKVVAN